MKRIARGLAVGVCALGLTVLAARPAVPGPPLAREDFVEVAPQGFGDRQNNTAWSMAFWNGTLYVGTARAWLCWTRAWVHIHFPFIAYPPLFEKNVECARDYRELPLQAEIWSHVPGSGAWDRVYQSPKSVEIPGSPGMFTARDMGFRGMLPYREADGTEALYVAGVTSHLLFPPMPPPRILRSTDGVTFQPIPEDPGTLLGSLSTNQTSFRGMVPFKGRFYVVNGQIRGQGRLLEADDPAGGNNHFRWATPEGVTLYEATPYNGSLYLGMVDLVNGFGVSKTGVSGTPPYALTPIVTEGGHRRPSSKAAIAMHVFNGRLYVGTDNPSEVIRINPDDSWDLVVGEPRNTPEGWKYPLSGLDTGFNWPFNQHIWRMQQHQGVLYVGTEDESTKYPQFEREIGWHYGADLYQTADGYYFTPITFNGFGDKLQNGIRTLASTPHGFFVGTASFWSGLRVWQGVPTPTAIKPPGRLEAEFKGGGVVLSWDRPDGAVRFHVYRSSSAFLRSRPPLRDIEPRSWVPGEFVKIAATEQSYFVDYTVVRTHPYQYYVLAEDAGAILSPPSNMVRAPSLAPTVSFQGLDEALVAWQAPPVLRLRLGVARFLAERGYLAKATQQIEGLRRDAKAGRTPLPAWRAEDLDVLTGKLLRRIRLAKAGVLSSRDLI